MREWKAIETAPKKGMIELWLPDDGPGCPGRATHGTWDDDRYAIRPRPYFKYDSAISITCARGRQPTHWREMPDGP